MTANFDGGSDTATAGRCEHSERESAVDEAALLEAWAREYRLPLLRFFQKRCAVHADPDDLVQEVFMRLAKRADLAAIERVEGYLFQTASSVLADRYRRDGTRARDAHDSFDETEHGASGLDPERVLLGRQSMETLAAALYELPERTRMIFVLYHFDHIPQTEIAARFGVGSRTVERHMAKATAHLLKRLGRC